MGPEQLAELVDRHAAALVLYARQWCSSPDDVVQTAFLKLARQSVPPDNLVPWLYRVVRNGAIDAARARTRREPAVRRRPARPGARPPAAGPGRGGRAEAALPRRPGRPRPDRRAVAAAVPGAVRRARRRRLRRRAALQPTGRDRPG